MDIVDFLPEYPSLNDPKFNQAIYEKKEFHDNILEESEAFPTEKGMLTKYQKSVVRFLSSYTPYSALLLVHAMGSGKTCSAIGAIEQIRRETDLFDGAIIIAKSGKLLKNFRGELISKCTAGYYYPLGYKTLTDEERKRREKKTTAFYEMETIEKFAKQLRGLTDSQINERYSDKIIVIDEVHNLRIDSSQKSAQKDYNEYHRLLHVTQNTKALLLSGTPMKDTPEEIATILNLILPLNGQLPIGAEFRKEYMVKTKGGLLMKESKTAEFQAKIRGLVSFLKEPTDNVEKIWIGEEKYGGLNHLIVNPLKMSKFQSAVYKEAYENKKGEKDEKKDSKDGIFTDARNASLCVFPKFGKDGEIVPGGVYGKELFTEYCSVKKKSGGVQYRLADSIRNLINAGGTIEGKLDILREYSCVYAEIIGKILGCKGKCFVYNSVVKGSGIILFGLLLELFGISKTGKENRYGLITGENDASATGIIRAFESPDNLEGEKMKVILGSKAISEGFSLTGVVFEAILTPHWNYSETAQAIARGIRLGSHRKLIAKYGRENVHVEIMQTVAIPDKSSKAPSIDLYMYTTSEDKDIAIRSILRLLMISAFDCSLNYIRNRVVNGVDGSWECDYTKCNYTCDGITNMNVSEYDLNVNTYQLYYINTKNTALVSRIEELLKKYGHLTYLQLLSNLQTEFPEEEIQNAVSSADMIDIHEKIYYTDFLEKHSKTAVREIIRGLEDLFRIHTSLTFSDFVRVFEKFSVFTIQTALKQVIDSNYVFFNLYGFPCYLREQSNKYFLISSLIMENSDYASYYIKNPTLVQFSPAEVLEIFMQIAVPHMIGQMCALDMKKQKDKDLFMTEIAKLEVDTQEIFLELAVIAQIRNIQKSRDIRATILDFYQAYILEIDGRTVSLLKTPYRIINRDKSGFTNCSSSEQKMIEEYLWQREEKLRVNNMYGILGKLGPIVKEKNGEHRKTFCIVDTEKEAKGGKSGKASQDLRKRHTGKNCNPGWKKSDLQEMAINRLKIPPTPNFKHNNLSVDEIKAKLKIKYDPNGDRDYLLRVLYWNSKDGGDSQNMLCARIQKFLDEKGLVLNDRNCGKQTKHKGGDQAKKKAEQKTKKLKAIPIVLTVETTDESYKGKWKELYDDGKIGAPKTDTLLLYQNAKGAIIGVAEFNGEFVTRIVLAPKTTRKENVIDPLVGAFPIKLDPTDKLTAGFVKLFPGWGFVSYTDQDGSEIFKRDTARKMK